MTRALATRLSKLERRYGSRRQRPALVFAIHADDAPGEIVGMSSGAGVCERQAWEPVNALIARAKAALGVRILWPVYRAPVPAVAAPDPVPAAPPPPPRDPPSPRTEAWAAYRKSKGY